MGRGRDYRRFATARPSLEASMVVVEPGYPSRLQSKYLHGTDTAELKHGVF